MMGGGTIRQRYLNSLSQYFCSNYDMLNDNIITGDDLSLNTCNIVSQEYDGYNCNVKVLFDGPIGHPFLNVQALNQSSMWGDYVVQLMYIADNVLLTQGFYWFIMSHVGVIYSIQPCSAPVEGPLSVSFQFLLSFEVFSLLSSQLETYRDQQQAAKAAYRDFEKIGKYGCSIDEYWDNIVEYLITAQDVIMEKSSHTFPTVKIDPINPIADTHVSGRNEVTTEEINSTEPIVDIFFPEKEYGHYSAEQ